MPTKGELMKRVQALEAQQEQLTELVQHLIDIAPTNMDDTPMALHDAKTWKHPEMAEHIYRTVENLVEESPNLWVSKREARHQTADEYGHTKEEVRATMKRLLDEKVMVGRDNRIRIHENAQDIDPGVLFKSNLTHAAERREEAAGRGKSVDNPDDKRS